MEDKKLTDKEIVKALEDCINHNDSCSSCPSNEFCYKHDSKVIMKATLDLINHQKADLAKKDKELLEELKYSAVYKTKVIDSEKEINRLNAEIERLKKEFIEQNLKNIMSLETSKEIKAEAYKEFAERLKTIMYENYQKFDEQPYPIATISIINNLLKELVGEE